MSAQKPWELASYSTESPAPKSMAARFFTSIYFYSKVMGTIWRASSLAQKNLYSGKEWIESSREIFQWLEEVGCTIEIEGMSNYQKLDAPCIFIGNHMSTLETFVLPCLIQPWKDMTFVVKESLVHYPLFGSVLRSRNPIVVGRVNPREDLAAVLGQGMEILNKGRSLIIFPQSTRTQRFDPKYFNTIGIKLARKAGVPVIPLALRTDAWGTSRLTKDFGPITPSSVIHFAFGEPLVVSGTGRNEHQQIVDFISRRLKSWGLPPVENA
ncbi:MAG: lysophospholipid acyltransferase family protein [Desulfovibrionaceae bacterium]|nr:lysophospholipid acyltransferase family protein [Desulfovibrionaceae bacterium]